MSRQSFDKKMLTLLLSNRSDPIIRRYFDEFIHYIESKVKMGEITILTYDQLFPSEDKIQNFLSLRYCKYCGGLMEEGHDCDESTRRREEEEKEKTTIVRKIDEFEELMRRVEKLKDIDWDEDFIGER